MRTIISIATLMLVQCASVESPVTPPVVPPDVISAMSSLNADFSLTVISRDDLNQDPLRAHAATLYTVLAHTYETYGHRMGGAIHNQIFVATDGHREAVYEFQLDEQGEPIESTGVLVIDCPNKGTYNYYHSEEKPLGHFAADILPWLRWGSCRDDPSTVDERVVAFTKDFDEGIQRTLINESGYYLPTEFLGEGESEALGVLLKAIFRGGFDLNELEPSVLRDEPKKALLLQALELGLKSLLAEKV